VDQLFAYPEEEAVATVAVGGAATLGGRRTAAMQFIGMPTIETSPLP
jgi:hypothetical protein